MEEPTFWQWAMFLASVALSFYALWVFISDRVPFLGRAGDALGRLLLVAVARFGDFAIDYVYLPIGRAILRLLVGFWHLPGILWRGTSGPILATAGADQPAPVSRISVPLPTAYVTAGAEAPHQNAPFAPSAVRPSAPDRPLVPVVPVAVERLMVDRSREALLDALVAAGWSTTQIRGLLRGANDAIGAEVEAARARLAAPRATPVAGRQLADGVEFRD
jgi:hypothetical protein